MTAFSPRTDVAQADEIAHKAHNERFGPRETALKLDEPGTLAKNFPKMGSPSGVHRHARFTPLRFWGGWRKAADPGRVRHRPHSRGRGYSSLQERAAGPTFAHFALLPNPAVR